MQRLNKPMERLPTHRLGVSLIEEKRLLLLHIDRALGKVALDRCHLLVIKTNSKASTIARSQSRNQDMVKSLTIFGLLMDKKSVTPCSRALKGESGLRTKEVD